ncbi:hypothetical protein THAOC_34030 [Thalassiosira oceanica]|uniref:B30.2/SPRY domain-containing protein n=1 Tax=Thalassiosira oceanica TaxID=159749 RepID=K0R468_THAOC|nr:hypothetical protein THAOC_34030 [Thalassiosira oceanica]|eukprot:EJK47260.1 hypothetical protein THAOC_34030 [Thalassiosira oceanica]
MNGLPDEQLPDEQLGVIRPVSLTDGIDLKTDWRGNVNPMIVSSGYIPAVAEKLTNPEDYKSGDKAMSTAAPIIASVDVVIGRTGSMKKGSSDWQGRESLPGSGTIGLLLDLDKGTLFVFKNGRRLGVMKEGLGGEYCWFVTVGSPCSISIRGRAPNYEYDVFHV